MIIAGILVLALVLTAAAWMMRPATAGVPADGHHRWSAGVIELFDQVRDTGRRFAHRNGHDKASDEPVAAPAIDLTTTHTNLSGFDLRSVAQFGIKFFGSFAAAACVGFAAVWLLASLVGVVGDLEQFMRDIGFAGFTFLSIEVILGVALLAAASVAFLVTLTVVAAALYNVLARRHGGIRIYTSESKPGIEALAQTNGDGALVSTGDMAPPSRETARAS